STVFEPVRRVVIVGGGMTAGNTAAGLRDEGYDGRITIVSDEVAVPFGRPPLSKTYLRGEEPLSAWFVKPPEWYEDADIDRRHGRVERIDAGNSSVALSDGSEIGCDRVVIATGSRPRKPDTDLDGVVTLRTQADADAIRRHARPGEKAVVVGMSFIGAEVAASLRQLSVDVTAVFPG